jgi:CO/xanthine dehydrogenase FAD-binding subunit
MPYLAPTNFKDAVQFLATSTPRIIAGCTDYFPSLPHGTIHENLLDISRIEGMRGITQTDDGWRIGAGTTWTDIARSNLPPAFDGLRQAAVQVGSLQIQNQGTLAGNICNASPAADGVPPLLALNARVEVGTQTGNRMVALSDFITGVRQIDLALGEIVVALHVPHIAADAKSAFLKLGSREHLVISIAMVATVVRITQGKLSDVRIAVGSCSPVATRLPDLEALLTGLKVTDLDRSLFSGDKVLSQLSPITDVRGSADYRVDVVSEMCCRAVLTACKEVCPWMRTIWMPPLISR